MLFTGSDGEILNETRFDYYTRCTYEFTFQYVKEEVIPKEYKFTEGANQTYTIDESKNATFRIDANYSLFTNKVYVDNKLVDSTNYDSKSGSTVITLKDEYLKTLSVGEHTLKATFTDGGEATTKFIVKAKQQNIDMEDDKKTENEGRQESTNIENTNIVNDEKDNNIQKENNSMNPKTGDTVIVYFVLFAISIVGIITLVMINRKKVKNNIKGRSKDEK